MKYIPIILVLIVLFVLACGYFMFYLATIRKNKKASLGQSKWLGPYKNEIISGGSWFKSQNPERIQIRSVDGLLLTGYYLEASNAIGTVLLVHGYRSDPYSDFGVSLPYYHSLGLNILAVYQRSHGESEGQYITFGIKERYDICSWANYLYDRLGQDMHIILAGISMGSSTVLMSLGTNLPPNVKFVIADCGYTSPYDEFAYLIPKKYHIPASLALPLMNYFSRMFADFRFQDYSTVTALSNNRIPVLFVHGEKDGLVPIQFTTKNYESCIAEKYLIKSPNAGHGGSYFFSREDYQSTITYCLEKYLK